MEIAAFSNEISTLKTMSRRKSECMVLEGNFLGFKNIESEFPQHLSFSQTDSIFKHHFLTKILRFAALGASLP